MLLSFVLALIFTVPGPCPFLPAIIPYTSLPEADSLTSTVKESFTLRLIKELPSAAIAPCLRAGPVSVPNPLAVASNFSTVTLSVEPLNAASAEFAVPLITALLPVTSIVPSSLETRPPASLLPFTVNKLKSFIVILPLAEYTVCFAPLMVIVSALRVCFSVFPHPV